MGWGDECAAFVGVVRSGCGCGWAGLGGESSIALCYVPVACLDPGAPPMEGVTMLSPCWGWSIWHVVCALTAKSVAVLHPPYHMQTGAWARRSTSL